MRFIILAAGAMLTLTACTSPQQLGIAGPGPDADRPRLPDINDDAALPTSGIYGDPGSTPAVSGQDYGKNGRYYGY